MKLRLAMAALLLPALMFAASPPAYPVLSGVRMDGDMLRVGNVLSRKGFVMTGFVKFAADSVFTTFRGPVFNMEDVDVKLVSGVDEKVCEVEVTMPAGDEWRQVRFVYDAVASSLTEQYGRPKGTRESYGDRSDYSPATKMIRLQRGYVVLRQWWHVGPWTVTEYLDYGNHMGIVKVKMVRDREQQYAGERKSGKKAVKEKAPKEPKQRKEKTKKEKEPRKKKADAAKESEKVQEEKPLPVPPAEPAVPVQDTVSQYVIGAPVEPEVAASAAKDTVREHSEEYKVIYNIRYGRKAVAGGNR